MSKFSIAARIVELSQVNTAPVFSSAAVEETLLQHFLKTWRSRRVTQLKPVPSTQIEPQIMKETGGEPATHQASPYDLASNNPHIIAATLFSRKRW